MKVCSKLIRMRKKITQAVNVLFLVITCWVVQPLTASAHFNLSLNYDSYMTSTSLKDQMNHYVALGLDMKHNQYSENWFYGMESTNLFFIDVSNQNYLAIPNLFFGYELTNIINDYTINLIFGRYKTTLSTLYEDSNSKNSNQPIAQPEFWNVMDEIWEMGLWQARINWDYLLPRPQGLTGSFLTIKKDPYLLTVFLSGLFLPEQGPSVDITKDGKILSGSRWFTPPASNLLLFNQRIETLYWMNTPYLKNILLNDSIAFRMRVGDIQKQWMSLSYARKPMNQIYFTVDSVLSLKKTVINNVIFYQLFPHSLFSAEFGTREKWLSAVLSVTQEQPRRTKTIKNREIPLLPQAFFVSSHIRLHLPQNWIMSFIDFNFIHSHFKEANNDQIKTNPHLKGKKPSMDRFKLYHGYSFAIKSRPFKWRTQHFSINSKYWHSIPDQGDLLSFSIDWHITPQLQFVIQADILGSGESEDNKNKGFFNTYKQNDRITVKVEYEID